MTYREIIIYNIVYIIIILLIFVSCSKNTINKNNSYKDENISKPEYLRKTIDPFFHTKIVRITDAGQSIYNPLGDFSLKGLKFATETGHGYSSRVAWNADESLLLLEKGVDGSLFLNGRTFEPLFHRKVPGSVRWHPTDPNIMFYVCRSSSSVGAYEPRADRILWQYFFSGFDSLSWSNPGKGKPSVDGNIIPIRARRRSDRHWFALLYYVEKYERLDEIDMTPFVDSGDEPNFTMSPRGDIIIINGCIIGHDGGCEAQIALDVTTKKELWRILTRHDPGHADEAIDQYGEQWQVGVSKEGIFKGHIIKRHFKTGKAISLIPYWGSHVSTRSIFNSRPMAIVSYHTPPGPFQNEILGVCLDGSCLERYAHSHRRRDARYLSETHASVSPFGNKIVFRSNWNGNGEGTIDAYVIVLNDISPLPDLPVEKGDVTW